MKKVWQVVVLAAFMGLAINTFADVQNIRISGDIRIRGYYLANVAGDDDEDQAQVEDNFISQRTRVTVEADLEDHILIVVTLKAEGLWGQDNQTDDIVEGSGAGTVNTTDDESAINRRWDLGVTEAYVQFSEMFYAPMTLKVGRQYLHYGHGLIISAIEQEYNYDAARLVLDYYPLTVDLVLAKLAENGFFGPGTSVNDVNLLFINARYEFTDSLLKNVEAYFGYVINNEGSGAAADNPTRIPPINGISPGFDNGDSPMIIGLRSDMNITENFQMWVEGAYEFGSASAGTTENISAFLANIGGKFSLKDVQMTPIFNFNYIYASGGGSEGQHDFRPWFDYVEGYNGYLFMPLLSNVHIFNLGASIMPSENTSFSLQGYYYMRADTGNLGFAGLRSNRNVDFGGLGYSPTDTSRDMGWEFDAIFGYDYSKDVRFQLVYAVFIPENGFTTFSSDALAHLLRGEINARF